MTSLALQAEIDRAVRESLQRHTSRVESEMARQFTLWGEQNHPDGIGPHYEGDANWFRWVTEKATTNKTLTWADIFLEEVYEAMAEDDDAKFEEEIVQVEAVLRSWIAARARRKIKERAEKALDN